MKYSIARSVLVLLSCGMAHAYIQRTTDSGALIHRTDAGAIQFYLNSSAAAGLQNSSGGTFITPTSNPPAAIQAALDQWNRVGDSRARFLSLKSTGAFNDPNDNTHVIVFRDTPEIRSIVGSALAVTNIVFDPSSGAVLDTDILFNPLNTYSTRLEPNTFDIQAIATHELGHALGAKHSGVLGVTMFQTTSTANPAQRWLEADDLAFVSSAYPSSTAVFGTLSGSVNAGGSPLRGALITAVDASTGIIVGGLTDLSSGQYSFHVPPGSYYVYAEPLTGQVKAGNLNYSQSQVDTGFQPGIAGGFGSPTTFSVTANQTVTASFAVPAGTSPIQIEDTGIGAAGALGDATEIFTGPQTVPWGASVDLLMYGAGIDTSLTEQNILVLGPATLKPGSLRRDNFSTTIMRFTLQIPARISPGLVSVLINKGGNTAAYSGGVVLLPPRPAFPAGGVANAFASTTGPVAPGEDLSIYGVNLGPAAAGGGIFDVNNGFSTMNSGVTVTFDGKPAPLLYVSAGQVNVQVPYEVAGKSTTEAVVSYFGSVGNITTLNVAATSPAIYSTIVNQDGTFNSASNPAPRGTYPTIYILGLGQVNPPVATGLPASLTQLSSAVAPVTVTMGGLDAGVYFAGLTPGSVGLGQVDAQVPLNAPTGMPLAMLVKVGGVATQPNINLYAK